MDGLIRKMVCVGVGSRSSAFGIESYNLVPFEDPNGSIQTYSVAYLIEALKRHEMAIANITLNPSSGLLQYHMTSTVVSKTSVPPKEPIDAKNESKPRPKKKHKTKRRSVRKKSNK